MEKSDAHEVVADLLRLRRWAIAALSNQSADPGPVAGIAEEQWRLFLSLERCACALLERLISAGILGDLSQAARTTLGNAAATETQSVLTARAEGREIAKITSRLDFPVVVLKGGVHAISNATPTLPLVDIDLLVQPENVPALIDALAAAGFGTPAKKLLHHQGIAPSTGRLGVEVHWTTHDDGSGLDPATWTRLRPIEAALPLKRLGAADNLLHLIGHAIVVHRDRSVSIRDTILIGIAAKECSEHDLVTVRSALADAERNDAMVSLLEFATSMVERRSTDDPFTQSCATFYSAIVLSPLIPKRFSSNGAMAFALELELGRIPRTTAMRNSLRWRGTGNEALASIADRLPFVGHVVLAPAHLAYYAVFAAFTIPSIRATRNRALSALDR